MTEFSVARDPDGEPSLDIWLERDHMVSLSLHPNGHISWAGVFAGTPAHGVIRNDPLGTLLFRLLDKAARLVPDDESVRRNGAHQ